MYIYIYRERDVYGTEPAERDPRRLREEAEKLSLSREKTIYIYIYTYLSLSLSLSLSLYIYIYIYIYIYMFPSSARADGTAPRGRPAAAQDVRG